MIHQSPKFVETMLSESTILNVQSLPVNKLLVHVGWGQ